MNYLTKDSDLTNFGDKVNLNSNRTNFIVRFMSLLGLARKNNDKFFDFRVIKLKRAILSGVVLLLLSLLLSSAIIFQMGRLQKSALSATQELLDTQYAQAFSMYQAVSEVRFRIAEIDQLVANASFATANPASEINIQIDFIQQSEKPIFELANLMGNQRISLLGTRLAAALDGFFKNSTALSEQRWAARSHLNIKDSDLVNKQNSLSTMVRSTATTLSELAKAALNSVGDELTQNLQNANNDSSLGQNIILAVNVCLLIFTLIISFLLIKSLVSPLVIAINDIDRVSRGDLTPPKPLNTRLYEMNLLRNALAGLIDTTRLAKELSEKQRLEEAQKEVRRQQLETSIAEFRHVMKNLLELLNNRSENVRDAAEILHKSADQTRSSVLMASSSSTQTLAQITAVANSAVELDVSIQEIITQVGRASHLSETANLATNRADETMKLLQDAVHKIGEVVDFIREIAEQTNLLSLNATIESARAGVAGLGFAVVAKEVKQLSSQTTEATEIIAKHIGGVELATKDAFAAVQSLREMIQEVTKISGSVVASVTQQGVATSHIAQNVESISHLAGDVSATVEQVHSNADITAETAQIMINASNELSEGAMILKNQVGEFLATVSN